MARLVLHHCGLSRRTNLDNLQTFTTKRMDGTQQAGRDGAYKSPVTMI